MNFILCLSRRCCASQLTLCARGITGVKVYPSTRIFHTANFPLRNYVLLANAEREGEGGKNGKALLAIRALLEKSRADCALSAPHRRGKKRCLSTLQLGYGSGINGGDITSTIERVICVFEKGDAEGSEF